MGKTSFVMISTRIYELGLNSYERDILIALKLHGDKDGSRIFPSWKRLMELTGMSKDRLWKSLLTLKSCSIIQWDRGSTGISNFYDILPEGLWLKKQVRVVRVADQGGPCGVPPVVRYTDPNYIHGTISNELEKPDFISLIKTKEKKLK